MHSFSVLAIFLLSPLVLGVPCDETYNVSKSSHMLANFHNITIPFLNKYLIDPLIGSNQDPWARDLENVLEHCLPYGFIVLVTGIAMFITFFVVFLVQACCKCCSSPGKSVWQGSVRLVRFSLITGCFFVALAAATGLFYSGQFYGHLAEPLVRVSQTVNNDYTVVFKLWHELLEIAPQFGVPIPATLEQILDQYLSDMLQVNDGLLEATDLFTTYSAYFVFLLAFTFGLVICVCVFATMVAIQKTESGVPGYTIFTLLLVVLFIWILATITTVGALGIAKQCDIGIDRVVRATLEDKGMPPCLSLIATHFMFCSPWPSSGDACGGNPFTEAIGFAETALQYIEKLPNINTINMAIEELNLISRCTPTSNSYKAAKSSLCWDTNNNVSTVSILLLMQTPLLLVVLCLMLYAWHAFGMGFGVVVYQSLSDDALDMSGYTRLSTDSSDSDCPVDLDGFQTPKDALGDVDATWSRKRLKTTISHTCKLLTDQPAGLVLSSVFAVVLVLVAILSGVADSQFEVYEPECPPSVFNSSVSRY